MAIFVYGLSVFVSFGGFELDGLFADRAYRMVHTLIPAGMDYENCTEQEQNFKS